MMALLLLIGQKLEAPEIIDQLLDVEKNPRKPQYRWIVFQYFHSYFWIQWDVEYFLDQQELDLSQY